MSLKTDTFTVNSTTNRSRCARIMWNRVSMENINSYKLDLDLLLTECRVPHDLLQCSKTSCKSEIHQKQIIALHNHITQSCLAASNKNIPFNKTKKLTAKKKSISGWNDYIKEHREGAIFGIICGSLQDLLKVGL